MMDEAVDFAQLLNLFDILHRFFFLSYRGRLTFFIYQV